MANFMAMLVRKKIVGFVLAFVGMDVWFFFFIFWNNIYLCLNLSTLGWGIQ